MPDMHPPQAPEAKPRASRKQGRPDNPARVDGFRRRLRPAGVAASLLLALLGLSWGVALAGGSCSAAAEDWIAALPDKRRAELFRRYAGNDCEFAARWVKEYAGVSDIQRRDRMCTDLVLLWTHKDCNYFRDVIDPEAYEPCKEWSREMYRHCLEDDLDWFP